MATTARSLKNKSKANKNAVKKTASKKKASKPAKAKKAAASKVSYPTLLNDGSKTTIAEIETALEHAEKLKVRHVKGLIDVHVPKKGETIADAKKAAGIEKLHPEMNVAEKLLLSGDALEHWNAISRNRLHAKFGNPESRNARVAELVEQGKIKSVPQTLAEYAEKVIAPLCASGHISNCASETDPTRLVSRPSQKRPFLRAQPYDALVVLIGFAAADDDKHAKASVDLLNTRFYPSVKYIAELLAAKANAGKTVAA